MVTMTARLRRMRPLAEPGMSARRRASIADWLARLALLVFALAILAHRYEVISTPELYWLLAAVGIAALVVLMVAAAAIARAWAHGELGAGIAVRAALIAALLLAPYLYAGRLVLDHPALDDVATDPVDPPVFVTLAAQRRGTMNRIDAITPDEAARQLAAYPEVTGRRYGAAPDTVTAAIDAVMAELGWRVVARRGPTEESADVTIEAVARSRIVGFVSDAALRVVDEGETTYVDLRVAARYGRHDLGANARRILRFLEMLDAEVAARAGGHAGS